MVTVCLCLFFGLVCVVERGLYYLFRDPKRYEIRPHGLDQEVAQALLVSGSITIDPVAEKQARIASTWIFSIFSLAIVAVIAIYA